MIIMIAILLNIHTHLYIYIYTSFFIVITDGYSFAILLFTLVAKKGLIPRS